MLAELLLAGDIYGMDTVNPDDAPDSLVLSTVHQAKGLEWSRVFVLRMIEDSFPHYRALNEPGGEEEERRIFYVAVSRAMDELYLVYPMTVARGGRGPNVLAKPSRFLTEVDRAFTSPWSSNVDPSETEERMGAEPTDERPETPESLLDALRAHAEWSEREREAVVERIVSRFAAPGSLSPSDHACNASTARTPKPCFDWSRRFPRPRFWKPSQQAYKASPICRRSAFGTRSPCWTAREP